MICPDKIQIEIPPTQSPIAEYSTRYMEFICKLRVKPIAEFTCIMRSIGHA